MPWQSALPAHASCARWPAVAFIMVVAARCCVQSERATPATPLISSSSSLFWWGAGCLSPSSVAAMETDGARMRSSELDPADWVRGHSQWLMYQGFGASINGRLPALVSPLTLLAEGWPSIFLPAWSLEGRQFISGLESPASSDGSGWSGYGDPGAPSGSVPGGDGIGSVPELIRTRLRFLFPVWDPPCKNQGPSCSFRLCLDPVVICFVRSPFKN
ncbi:hypothetical protein CFC21_072879 [Triticum aestivum]|uniref:Secreted protein n=2 Tax=Triticum aestivum TaxID=4565 RepID=A0A9R1HJ94_WHEAT|nr:hypothetical protein CFC21_072879 [Triticum aestivum]